MAMMKKRTFTPRSSTADSSAYRAIEKDRQASASRKMTKTKTPMQMKKTSTPRGGTITGTKTNVPAPTAGGVKRPTTRKKETIGYTRTAKKR